MRLDETVIDHPGEITWHRGRGPREVIGPCPHDCPHEAGWVVADGPDHCRYVLVDCVDERGCQGQCRAWQTWDARIVSPYLLVASAAVAS